MEIWMDGRKIRPQRKQGLFAAGFHRERDGSITYTEYEVDTKGRPDKDHPILVVEISKDTVESLEVMLAKNQSKETPQSLRARAEMLEALQKLETLQRQTEDANAHNHH